MSYVLGLDLGTSSLKGILINRNGHIVAEASSEYPLYMPRTGYSEQDPNHWTQAAVIVIKRLLDEVADIKDSLEGISFSGQMHSLVLLDEQDKPLRNTILWNDMRTSSQCGRIMDDLGEDIIHITKNIALEGFTLPKLLWIQENEPEIWQKSRHFLLPKDYLGFFLTGNKQMEYSDAAGTLMLDVENKIWSEQIANAFNIPDTLFPKLVESTDKIGVLKPALKTEFGFSADIPVFAGGADNACSAIGAGITSLGRAMASIGTSGVFLSYEDGGRDYNGKLHYFNHAVKDSFYSMGVSLAAGHSLNWFKQTFAENESFDSLLHGISDLPIGPLLFTPYIKGERTPHADSRIRGSFIGVDTNHTRKHFTKAVLEGITFSLKDSQSLIENVAEHAFHSIVSVGGGAKNPDWLQMQADIFNAPVIALKTEQGPAMGAAIIAAVGAGWFDDINACVAEFVTYKDEIRPIAANSERYKEVYALYKQIYPATKDLCHRLLGTQ